MLQHALHSLDTIASMIALRQQDLTVAQDALKCPSRGA